eukprot:6471056-Amphidinium_carterae.1
MPRSGAKKSILKVHKPLPTSHSDGGERWNETQKVRQQPSAAASTTKWDWWDETQKKDEQEPELIEAEGKGEGRRTVNPNIECEVCSVCGVWSEFAYAEVDDELNWRPSNVHAPKLMDVVALVKRVHGGIIRQQVPEEQIKKGKVVLACYKCWIRATKKKDY